MKALMFITGRGIGGDAGIAYNILKSLEEKYNMTSKVVLDNSAQGLLFKKHDMNWLTTPIPAAGGHAASKTKLAKAGISTITAGIKAANLIRKENPDIVIGVIGGGAVIGCVGAKLAHKPSIGIVSTPTDTKVCSKITEIIMLPEATQFTDTPNNSTKNKVHRAYIPINTRIINGDEKIAKEKMPSNYDPTKPTILFTSGSTLFDKMAQSVRIYAETNPETNIIVIGYPLNKQCEEYIDHPNIINLGYVDWINDLYKIVDLTVTTDDGLTLHELISCKIPVVIVIGVKYGRYHNLSSVFKGAMLETKVENITKTINEALENIETIKLNVGKYSKEVLDSPDKIGKIIINKTKK
ncbi:MAG: glycosyltransferase family 1 protein [Methanobacteriaceae archaeon]|nr:glycosyltransferase family 1 protein [Methanobacteriaceae archaeon]